MTKRQAWKEQLDSYKKQLAHWEAQPATQPDSGIGGTRAQNIARLRAQIEQHRLPENRPR